MTGPVITIEIPAEIAQRISHGLSDIALWCHGFNAALSQDEGSRRPWGTDAITDMNIRLKNALDAADDLKAGAVDEALTEVMVMAFSVSSAATAAGDDRAHAAAAYIHDRIVNARLKHKGKVSLTDASPWPFPAKDGGAS